MDGLASLEVTTLIARKRGGMVDCRQVYCASYVQIS